MFKLIQRLSALFVVALVVCSCGGGDPDSESQRGIDPPDCAASAASCR